MVAWAVACVMLLWAAGNLYLKPLSGLGLGLFWGVDFARWVVLPLGLMMLLSDAQVRPGDYGLALDGLFHRWFLPVAVLASLTTILIYFPAYQLLWDLFDQPTGYFNYPDLFPSGWGRDLLWIYSAVTAGVVESIFFIGLPWLLYANLRKSPSRLLFTLVISVIFALIHWKGGPHLVGGAFLSHLVGCFWYFRRGNLWPVIVAHTSLDLIAFS